MNQEQNNNINNNDTNEQSSFSNSENPTMVNSLNTSNQVNAEQQLQNSTYVQQIVEPAMTNTIPNEGQQKKKSKGLAIGIGVAVLVIIAITIVVIISSNNQNVEKESNSSKDSTVEPSKNKKINYFNDNDKITDKISFLHTHDINDKNNVFLGISEKNISSPLKAGSQLRNDTITLTKLTPDISFTYGGQIYNFDFEYKLYYIKNDHTAEYIEDEEVLYKDNNYYITDKNYVYYKYEETGWDSHDYGEKTSYSWRFINMGHYSDIEKAKEAVSNYQKNFYICTYTDSETISKCNYKEYRLANDMIIDLLRKYNIYVDSYDKVTFYYNYTKVNYGDYYYDISFSSTPYTKLDDYKKFKLNDADFYIKDRYIYYNTDKNSTNIYAGVDYELTNEEIISQLIKDFSK